MGFVVKFLSVAPGSMSGVTRQASRFLVGAKTTGQFF